MPPDPEAQLADPSLDLRLAALRRLAAGLKPVARLGTNLHLHTNHSFSVFASPCAAAWQAAKAGIAVVGINDFFTVSGHSEFAVACAALGLPATFNLECIAMDRAAEQAGVLMNDPGNPGKIYLCGKGVTRADHHGAAKTLAALRERQETRNRAMVARLGQRFRANLGAAGPTWAAVVEQTPHGNTTERHVARAALVRITELLSGASSLGTQDASAEFITRLVGEPAQDGTVARENQIRSRLLKAGKPCYVPEDPAAFPTVAEIRTLFLQLGAIPTYPVLGNPVTGGEKDLAALCDRLAQWGYHALELIPPRNTDDRVAAVIAEAGKRGWPVFDGTEHNTPAMEPLRSKWGMDERFRPYFHDSALVLLGHQALVKSGRPGYLDREGRPVPGGFAACQVAGRKVFEQTTRH